MSDGENPLPPAYLDVPEHIRRAAKETAAKAPPLSPALISQIAALLAPYFDLAPAPKATRSLKRSA